MLADKSASGDAVKNENMSKQELAEELQKTIIRIFENRKIYSSLVYPIYDLANMQLISKFNQGIRFYYVLLIFSINTHGLFVWKIKKVLQLLMLFKKY